MATADKSKIRFFGYIFLGWTVIAVFFTVQDYVASVMNNRPFDLEGYLIYRFSDFYLWAAITPFLVGWIDKIGATFDKWMKTGGLLLISGIPLALLHRTAAQYLNLKLRFLGGEEQLAAFLDPSRFWPLVVTGSFSSYTAYILMLVVILGFRFYSERKNQELKASKMESRFHQARLQSLKGHLHPHFLFNTLNGITSLVNINPSLAVKMISKLSDLLRYSLDRRDKQFTTLDNEIQFTGTYLEIEKMRLGERLEYRFDVNPELHSAVVPFLILQPLIENAIRHGIAPHRKTGMIHIRVWREDESLKMRIEDNGKAPEMLDASLFEQGLGLSITRDRLEQLYGNAYSFEISGNSRGGVTITLALPYNTELPDETLNEMTFGTLPFFEEVEN